MLLVAASAFGSPRTNQSVSREVKDNKVGRCTLPRPSRLKMLRFLKNRLKLSKPVPPENSAHQITDLSAECDTGDPAGEHYSRTISELTELIRPWNQIPSTEGVIELQTWMGGLRINSFPRRTPQLRPPGTKVATQVSVYLLGSMFNVHSHPESTPRTRTRTRGLRGRTE